MIVKKLSMTLLTFLLAVLLLAACGNNNDGNNNNNDNNAANNNAADELDIPEPDLDDLPDVVATVDGEDITKDDFEAVFTQQFQQAAMMAQMTGQEIDQDDIINDVLESLIDQQVFFNEAEKEIKEVDEDDVEEFLEGLMAQVEVESKEELFELYEEQGNMSEDEVMHEVELQIRVNTLIDKLVQVDDVTEDEAKELYEELKAQEEDAEEVPEFDEVKDQILANLKQEREAEELQKVIQSLRDKADIEKHI